MKLTLDRLDLLPEHEKIEQDVARNAKRYEKVRKLTPQQFSGLWLKAMVDNVPFDDLIDAWLEK